MLLKSTLLEILGHQQARVTRSEKGMLREALGELPELETHALIVSGVSPKRLIA